LTIERLKQLLLAALEKLKSLVMLESLEYQEVLVFNKITAAYHFTRILLKLIGVQDIDFLFIE
jgi:hypothetical protein